MQLRSGRRLPTILVAVSLAACSVFRASPDVAAGDIEIQVENQNFYDATVYVRWQSGRQRLGTVTGHTQQSFTTPWRGPQLQVEIELLAGGRRTGDRVTVGPDDVVLVEVLAQTGRVRTRVM